MADLSALAPITTTATALSNLVLVSPQKTIGYQPQSGPSQNTNANVQQPPAFMFNYEGEQVVTLDSEITDHYVEKNTSLQDQIALKPEHYVVRGFIGELNDIAPLGLQTIEAIADKLTVIDAYTPDLSETALIAYNTAFQLYQVAQNASNAAIAAWSSVTGSGGESVIGGTGLKSQPNQTKQQLAFQQLYGYQRNRTLFTVQTPWAVFQDMALMKIKAVQDPETQVITDFELTFKLMRFADVFVTGAAVQFDINDFQGRSADQAAGTTNLGVQSPPAVPTSPLDLVGSTA